MKSLLAMVLMAALLEACSPASAHGSDPNSSSNHQGIASIATEGRFTDGPPPEGTAAAPAFAITVKSPPIILTPIQGSLSAVSPTPVSSLNVNWKIFTSAALGVTMDYPPDWSVTEQPEQATFSSPQGTEIILMAASPSNGGNEFRQGNQVCTDRTNAFNLQIKFCADNASFTYFATFNVQAADGSSRVVALGTTGRTAGKVFEQMAHSLRLSK